MTSCNNPAVVYVASKRRYVVESIASLSSVRHWMPAATAYLKVASPELVRSSEARQFDRVLIQPETHGGCIDKAYFLEGVVEDKVLFLDGDTFVCGDLCESFDLLNRFDVAAAHAPVRHVHTMRDVPEAFPELNTGVIFARNSAPMRELCVRWRETHVQLRERAKYIHDQPAFRKVVWESRVALYVLPPEYNARLIRPIFLSSPAKVLHCRFLRLDRIAQRVNERRGPRVFVPSDFGHRGERATHDEQG